MNFSPDVIGLFHCYLQMYTHSINFGFSLSRTWEKLQVAMLSYSPPTEAMTVDIARKLREEFGLRRLKVAITGAAPTHLQVLEYFNLINLPLLELFGMSELTGPGTFNLIGRNKLGSVGIPMQGSRVKINCPNKEGEGEVSDVYLVFDNISVMGFSASRETGW